MTENLHETMDAVVWAREFCKCWPMALCEIEGKEGAHGGEDFEDTMIGWFANAIMTGYDKGRAEVDASDTPEVLALVEALRMMIDQEVDYMTRNSLGDPEKQHSVKVSRAAIAAWEAKCA